MFFLHLLIFTLSEQAFFKVVIITDLGQRQKSALNAENTTDLPKLYRGLLYVVFHNLESQNLDLVMLKRI